ncbi:substrate-binding domain-containing protein [Actinopolymorpha sp. B11F2]|uniref:substrate-binding domain-containing protein n=1 Tax=Actinopolymorpha sp. B11F2 TaxID=3160862 RepID=UPI0032E4EEF1
MSLRSARLMTSIFLIRDDRILLLYRIGSSAIPDSWVGIGGHVDPALEVEGTFERGEGYRMMKERLAFEERDFTALFACNDQIAAGARQALLEHGLRVPEDVSMVGFDDLPPAMDIDLTTVSQPHEELGRTAVRLALQHTNHGGPPPHTVLGTHLVIRGSVQPLLPQ